MQHRSRFLWLAGLWALIMMITSPTLASAANTPKTGTHTDFGITYTVEGTTLSVDANSVRTVFGGDDRRQQVTATVGMEDPASTEDIVFSTIFYAQNAPGSIIAELPPDYSEMVITLSPSDGETLVIPLYVDDSATPAPSPSGGPASPTPDAPAEPSRSPEATPAPSPAPSADPSNSTSSPQPSPTSAPDDGDTGPGLPGTGWGELPPAAQGMFIVGALLLSVLCVRTLAKGANNA